MTKQRTTSPEGAETTKTRQQTKRRQEKEEQEQKQQQEQKGQEAEEEEESVETPNSPETEQQSGKQQHGKQQHGKQQRGKQQRARSREEDEDDDEHEGRGKSPEAAPPKKKSGHESNEKMADAFDELKMYEMHADQNYEAITNDRVAKELRARKDVVKSGEELGKIKGIGKESVAKINEFLKTGKIQKVEELREKYGELPKDERKVMEQKGSSKEPDREHKAKPLPKKVLDQIEKEKSNYMNKDKDALHELLSMNNGLVSGSKEELADRCAEGKVLGAFPNCPICEQGRPKLDRDTGVYYCRGWRDADTWHACIFESPDIKRDKWKE